jgi:hypothetical protein
MGYGPALFERFEIAFLGMWNRIIHITGSINPQITQITARPGREKGDTIHEITRTNTNQVSFGFSVRVVSCGFVDRSALVAAEGSPREI